MNNQIIITLVVLFIIIICVMNIYISPFGAVSSSAGGFAGLGAGGVTVTRPSLSSGTWALIPNAGSVSQLLEYNLN